MKAGTQGRASVHAEAAPTVLYDMVSDVARMGEWSPECQHCEWVGGATGPAVGARFKGSNRRGLARWSTKPRVVAAEPGREFAFVIDDLHVAASAGRGALELSPPRTGPVVLLEPHQQGSG